MAGIAAMGIQCAQNRAEETWLVCVECNQRLITPNSTVQCEAPSRATNWPSGAWCRIVRANWRDRVRARQLVQLLNLRHAINSSPALRKTAVPGSGAGAASNGLLIVPSRFMFRS
jgi:hypothetical protein